MGPEEFQSFKEEMDARREWENDKARDRNYQTQQVRKACLANPNLIGDTQMTKELQLSDDVKQAQANGVTYLCGSDRYGYDVIKVHTNNKLTMREVNRDGSISLHDTLKVIRRRKDGTWRDVSGMQYALGYKEFYLDPSF